MYNTAVFLLHFVKERRKNNEKSFILVTARWN